MVLAAALLIEKYLVYTGGMIFLIAIWFSRVSLIIWLFVGVKL